MSTSAAVTHAILSNDSYHAELVQSIDALNNIPAALKEQLNYMRSLQRQIEGARASIEMKREMTVAKRRAMKGSLIRKTASKLVGRADAWSAVIEREENEYVEALETEMQQRAKLVTLETMVDETSQTKLSLETKLSTLQTLQTDLSSLYSRVFTQFTQESSSSTPWSPSSSASSASTSSSMELEVDWELELEAHEAQKKAQSSVLSLRSQLLANQNAATWLADAKDLLHLSTRYIEEGLTQHARWGTVKSGLAFHMDRELREAMKACTRAETLVNEARSGEPLIQPLPPLVLRVEDCESSASRPEPTENESSSDPRAPDSSNRQSLLNKIKTHKSKLLTAQDLISSDIRSSNSRIQQLKLVLPWAEETLKEAEDELMRVRREIWDVVVTQSTDESESGQTPARFRQCYRCLDHGYG
ncbi:hypothetical protein D9758_006562 [Tetrapyrgos nigripes]|uniref:Uncharacterized protein n=1 Tax=Tetrapyrgos nigripes TaxID=182062 RepID=A0A8H5GL91_9AGAR|nr:hypothetical protein D9758_006562 [Tetrapyrgos nigripes]